MNRIPINRIIPFSNVDGPGNRLAIFVQKCPFRCWYCHNPETINMCVNCGQCVDVCPVGALSKVDGKVKWNSELCVQCDQCISTCKHLSSPKMYWMSVDDICAEIQKNRLFIRGITVSGGECMEYPEFLLELFTRVKEMGLTCFLDSNGYYDFKQYPELLEVCDAVMLDVKCSNDDFHRQLTSQTNETVLSNLEYLISKNKMYEVRTVLLNGYEDMNEQTVQYVSNVVQDHCRYKLIKYRPFGVRKEYLTKLGSSIVSDDELNRCADIARNSGVKDVVIV